MTTSKSSSASSSSSSQSEIPSGPIPLPSSAVTSSVPRADNSISSDEEPTGPSLPDNHKVERKSRSPPRKKPRSAKTSRKALSTTTSATTSLALKNLPSNQYYARSYMHKSVVTHVVTTSSFVVSASDDAELKFWAFEKPEPDVNVSTERSDTATTENKPSYSLQFVKSFRAHKGPLTDMILTPDQTTLLTLSVSDCTMKVFSVASFDMRDMLELSFKPSGSLLCVQSKRRDNMRVIIPHGNDPNVSVFLLDDLTQIPIIVQSPHSSPIKALTWNSVHHVIISIDQSSIFDYWMLNEDWFRNAHLNEELETQFSDEPNLKKADKTKGENFVAETDIPNVQFRFKTKTDLFSFAKLKIELLSLNVSPNGQHFACTASDFQVRVFEFTTGRIISTYDESLKGQSVWGIQQASVSTKETTLGSIPPEEFRRRIARERQLTEERFSLRRANILFDSSSSLLLYATVVGIKVIDLKSNRCLRVFGLREAAQRFLTLALHEGDLEMELTTGMVKSSTKILIATAFENQRIFLFGDGNGVESDRDVFNERLQAFR